MPDRPQHPFYDAPDASRFADAHSGAVVVGSDLVVTYGHDTGDLGHGKPGFYVAAWDSDGNELATLVWIPLEVSGVRQSVPAAYNLLPQAIDAAVRLFPNHLLTELS